MLTGGVAATAMTATARAGTTMASSVSTGGATGKGGGGKNKKGSAFKQPLRIPRRSPSNASDDGEGGDGWSFGNMMHMMMMQNRMDNERREQIETDRREQQDRIAEQREREYQLRREEMAVAREEAREQRQLMNLMFMSMLNRNGGSNSNPPRMNLEFDDE